MHSVSCILFGLCFLQRKEGAQRAPRVRVCAVLAMCVPVSGIHTLCRFPCDPIHPCPLFTGMKRKCLLVFPVAVALKKGCLKRLGLLCAVQCATLCDAFQDSEIPQGVKSRDIPGGEGKRGTSDLEVERCPRGKERERETPQMSPDSLPTVGQRPAQGLRGHPGSCQGVEDLPDSVLN